MKLTTNSSLVAIAAMNSSINYTPGNRPEAHRNLETSGFLFQCLVFGQPAWWRQLLSLGSAFCCCCDAALSAVAMNYRCLLYNPSVCPVLLELGQGLAVGVVVEELDRAVPSDEQR